MSIAKGPVKRPILTFVIFLIVVLLGIVSLTRLPIDLMPEINYPTISVITSYSSVGPQEIEEQVTRPIEEALSAVEGVEEITSTSSEGQSSVRISFEWGTDLDAATNDIRDRVDRILSRLPEGVERPSIRKFDVTAFPILIIGISANMGSMDLRQLIEDQVIYRFERLSGVASADVWGGMYREIHITANAMKLESYGLVVNDLVKALGNDNRNIPAGLFQRGDHEVLLRTQGEFESLDEIKNTVIITKKNVPILIGDVAEVVDSHEELTRLIRINGEPGIRISVSKQSGTNTVQVADEVHRELEQVKKDYPHIQFIPLIDTSKYITQSINNTGNALLLGGLLAILILFLFLRNISSTAIITTAVPVSIIATFGLLYFSGLTLNIMTFGGLALGIGMLLDSSIVVLENIYRHREEGRFHKESALIGTSEVWSAILASVLTTIVVFIPVIFVRGVSGIMFQQMAIVVSFSLLCSLVVSLTLIPMLCSKFLKYRPLEAKKTRKWKDKFYYTSENFLKKIESSYGRVIDWALSHRKIVVITTFTLFAISLFLIKYIGVELMPETDEGEVRVNIELPVGTQLNVTERYTIDIEEKVKKHVPEMVAMFTSIGGGGWRSYGGNTSRMRVILAERSERTRSSQEIAQALRGKLKNIPGAKVTTRAAGGLWLLNLGSSDDNISVEIRGHDLEKANELAVMVEIIMQEVNGITDTRISRQEGNPEQILLVDRQKAADLGLSLSMIGETLQSAISGNYVSYFREGGKQYRIMVRLDEQHRESLDAILNMTIKNNRGEAIILSNVVSTLSQEGPLTLERKDQERVIYVTGNFVDRDMGSIIGDIRERLWEIPVPKDFTILFGGDYEEQQRSFRELIFGFILAIVLVYLVMAGQFESFIDPFVILFSIPMAIIGIVITMILTGTVFSIQALIGCIMLAGIVVNNAILLVDYTNQLRRNKGYTLNDAVVTSGSRRLRPILMTTFTTILALLPLSFGIGEGGETQAPLARVVIGGLFSSTLITLVLVPVVYSIFEQRLKKKK